MATCPIGHEYLPGNGCPECHKKKRREWQANHVEEGKVAAAKYRRTHPDRHKARYINWCYGLSAEEYQSLLISQDNACAICKQVKKLQVDHCHVTGKVRGLLCGPCNRAIGLLGDTYDSVSKAVGYLNGNT